MIFDELNVFKPADARLILGKACTSLKPGGRLVLEPARPEMIYAIGHEPSGWWSSQYGLFGDSPHLVLTESFWDEIQRTATNRYYRIDAATGEVTRYASSQQAYTQEEYTTLLLDCGFDAVKFYPGLGWCEGDPEGQFCGVVAEKRK